MNPNFFGQTAVYDSGQYRTEPSCKKAKKSLEPFLRKTGNQLTINYYCDDSLGPAPTGSQVQNFFRRVIK